MGVGGRTLSRINVHEGKVGDDETHWAIHLICVSSLTMSAYYQAPGGYQTVASTYATRPVVSGTGSTAADFDMNAVSYTPQQQQPLGPAPVQQQPAYASDRVSSFYQEPVQPQSQPMYTGAQPVYASQPVHAPQPQAMNTGSGADFDMNGVGAPKQAFAAPQQAFVAPQPMHTGAPQPVYAAPPANQTGSAAGDFDMNGTGAPSGARMPMDAQPTYVAQPAQPSPEATQYNFNTLYPMPAVPTGAAAPGAPQHQQHQQQHFTVVGNDAVNAMLSNPAHSGVHSLLDLRKHGFKTAADFADAHIDMSVLTHPANEGKVPEIVKTFGLTTPEAHKMLGVSSPMQLLDMGFRSNELKAMNVNADALVNSGLDVHDIERVAPSQANQYGITPQQWVTDLGLNTAHLSKMDKSEQAAHVMAGLGWNRKDTLALMSQNGDKNVVDNVPTTVFNWANKGIFDAAEAAQKSQGQYAARHY